MKDEKVIITFIGTMGAIALGYLSFMKKLIK